MTNKLLKDFYNDIAKEAKTWLGTSFQHHQQTKQNLPYHTGGCDCAGLIFGLAKTLNIKSKAGGLLQDYQFKYARKPSQVYLLAQLNKHLESHNTIEIGHVVLLNVAQEAQHLGIISLQDSESSQLIKKQKLTIIHANENIGHVIEQPLNKFLAAEIVQIFSFIS